MHFVVFGLTVSSSWGNGHATLWRSLIRAMLGRGHTVIFYERDVPYYANTRDLHSLPEGAKLVLYSSLDEVREQIRRDLRDADVALSTSYCPDGVEASALILESRAGVKAFYDLDTPVTLDALTHAGNVTYLPASGLSEFDLVLSYTGGRALDELRSRLGARLVAPLYGWVDPDHYQPVPAQERFRSTLSYLGTYAADRQATLSRLFFETAARIPDERFLIGGAQYPDGLPWVENIWFVRHVPPSDHPVFFSSSRATLNVTREVMRRYGYCPQGRLFEAAACGTPLLSDDWEGLDSFFEPGRELVRVRSAEDVRDALSLSDHELDRIASAARERTLAEHTADRRVVALENICETAHANAAQGAVR